MVGAALRAEDSEAVSGLDDDETSGKSSRKRSRSTAEGRDGNGRVVKGWLDGHDEGEDDEDEEDLDEKFIDDLARGIALPMDDEMIDDDDDDESESDEGDALPTKRQRH